ncbi:MAG TPA: type IV secretory system conjugative DNA transfer family protein [Gaiellaceae bacterium]|nr:type IV secretory system conjugative DNA transfer family protein [Gaiellaceae bacterium]
MPLDLRSILFRPAELVWRELHFPSELASDIGVALLRQLGTDHFVRHVAFEVEGHGGHVCCRVGLPAPATARVEQLVKALVPDTALTTTGRADLPHAWRIALTTRRRALQISDPERVTRALLAALTAARTDEQIVVQWLLGPTHAPRPVAASESLAATENVWRALTVGQAELDPERRRALELKRSEHAFACVGRVAIKAAAPGRTKALAVGVLAALRTAEAPGIGIKLVKEPGERFNNVTVPWVWPSVLNVLELVGLLGWPLGDKPLPGVPCDESRKLRPDERIRPHRRVLGEATAPGEKHLVGLSIDDTRHHLHVVGPTGTGKSTLLGNLILQDIAAGRGVVVIEPKGDLVADVLARIPRERVDDVVVFDPSEHDYPVGLNPLIARGRSPELVADHVLAVFHGIYANAWGPRLQDILHAALLTLARRDEASICALPTLLTNQAIRRRLLRGIDDPIALEPFWAWFESISEAERQQAIAPVMSRLRSVLLRKGLRAIVGQVEPKFRIDEVFTKRKIVLVSLAKGLIGPEASALLGSLFVAELWQAILGRAAISPEKRHPVVVYADEFQDYVHLPTDMADALAQARGLGVGLVLAHQHLAQLPANLKAAVLANARSRVCFQLSGEDANVFAKFSNEKLKPVDFQRLRRYEAYAQLVAGGEVMDFASIRTLPLPAATSDPQAVRESSRVHYGRPVAEVEAEIRKLVEGDATTPAEDDIAPRRRPGGTS